MNKEISDKLILEILDLKKYLKNSSLKDSVKSYNELWGFTKEEREYVEPLKREKYYNTIIKSVLARFDALDANIITSDFSYQLKAQLQRLELLNKNASTYIVYFEFGDLPHCSGLCYPYQSVNFILDEPKELILENDQLSTNYTIDIDVSSILSPLYDADYEDMVWAFENEIEYFDKLNLLHYTLIDLCLHSALNDPSVDSVMTINSFHPNAIFFSGKHDHCRDRTIYIRNG